METVTDNKVMKEDLKILLKNSSLLTVSQVNLVKGLDKHLRRTGSLSERQSKLAREIKQYVETRL